MDENRKPKTGGAAILAVLLLLPVLYVASVGPACAMLVHDIIDSRTYQAIYWPVEWFAARSNWSYAALIEYQEFCGAENDSYPACDPP